MDSPLNLAHQQGRIADRLLKKGQYEEAICCHNRAAEYLLEAMQQTRYKPALESLKLQHAHHLKQTDKLYDAHRRAQLLQIKRNEKQQHHQACQTTLQGPVIIAPQEHSSFAENTQDRGTNNEDVSPQNDDSIYRTLTEQDSLIGFLLRRRQNQDDNNVNSIHTGVPVERVFFPNKQESSRPRVSPDREAEDLRYHNEDLRKHVTQLIEEVDKLKKENKKLKEREGFYSDVVGACDTNLIPDLPPLEMPTFDFNLLTSDESDGNNTFSSDLSLQGKQDETNMK